MNEQARRCCICHGPLDDEARGLYCVRCWIAYVRTFNPQEARRIGEAGTPAVEQLALFGQP